MQALYWRHNRPDWQLFLEHNYEENGEIKMRPAGDIRYVQPAELLEKIGKKKSKQQIIVMK